MGKKRKGRQLHRGPFTAAEIERELQRVGFVRSVGSKHVQYKHPSRPGKVSISRAWTGIRASDEMFKSLARQAGYSKQEFLELLNGLDP